MTVLVFCAASAAQPSAAQGRAARPPAPAVPLVVGLVAVGAVHEVDEGDYESIARVDRISADAIEVNETRRSATRGRPLVREVLLLGLRLEQDILQAARRHSATARFVRV